MSRNHKRSSLGWALVISLGIASSAGVVHAGSISDTYTTGDTLTATKMNNIKTAVDDNDTRVSGVIANTQAGALKTAVDANTTATGNNATAITNLTNSTTTELNNLKGNYANGSCRTNAGAVDANMVRVGPVCVDKNLARADFTGCSADGTTGCGAAIALNTGGGSPTTNMSWAQAVRACTNAGKRLLTPGEYMAAYISGSLLETLDDRLEFVDAMLSLSSTTPGVDPAGDGLAWSGDPSGPGPSVPAQGGYMGPRTAATSKIQMITNVDYDATGFAFIVFRCAR